MLHVPDILLGDWFSVPRRWETWDTGPIQTLKTSGAVYIISLLFQITNERPLLDVWFHQTLSHWCLCSCSYESGDGWPHEVAFIIINISFQHKGRSAASVKVTIIIMSWRQMIFLLPSWCWWKIFWGLHSSEWFKFLILFWGDSQVPRGNWISVPNTWVTNTDYHHYFRLPCQSLAMVVMCDQTLNPVTLMTLFR